MLKFGREEQRKGVGKTKQKSAVFVTFFPIFRQFFDIYRPIGFTDLIEYNNN